MTFSSLPLSSRLILGLGLLVALGAGIWPGLSERRLLASWQAQAPPPEPPSVLGPRMRLNHILLAQELTPVEQLERLRALGAQAGLEPKVRARVFYEAGRLEAQALGQIEDLEQRARQTGWAIEAFEQAKETAPKGPEAAAAQAYLTVLRPEWARLQRALGDAEMRRLAQLPPEALIPEIERYQAQARQGEKEAQRLGLWAIEVLEAKTQDYPWFPLLEATP